MEEYQTQPPVQEPPKKSKRGFKLFLYILLILLVAGVAAYGVYVWQQNEVNNLRSEISAVEAQSKALAEKRQEVQDEAENEENEESDDEKATLAFNNYCAALAVPQGARPDPSIGTVTEDQKRIVYSADSTFAAVNASCFTSVNPEQQGGGHSIHMLKKANETWLVILRTQQRPLEEQIKAYAIPEEFLATLDLSQ